MKKESNRASMDASSLITSVVSKHPEIAGIHVFEARPTILVQERFTPVDDELSAIEKAIDFKRKYHLPFWEGVLLSLFNAQNPSKRLLRAAAHHNQNTENLLFIGRDILSAKYLRDLAGGFTENRMLAVSSLVELKNGEQRHLPMLDFHYPASSKNLELAKAISKELQVGGGYILESGDSFHFYGKKLLDKCELVNFLARALLYSPIVDRAWIAHQLIESACALRISPRRETGMIPRVVARVIS